MLLGLWLASLANFLYFTSVLDVLRQRLHVLCILDRVQLLKLLKLIFSFFDDFLERLLLRH